MVNHYIKLSKINLKINCLKNFKHSNIQFLKCLFLDYKIKFIYNF